MLIKRIVSYKTLLHELPAHFTPILAKIPNFEILTVDMRTFYLRDLKSPAQAAYNHVSHY